MNRVTYSTEYIASIINAMSDIDVYKRQVLMISHILQVIYYGRCFAKYVFFVSWPGYSMLCRGNKLGCSAAPVRGLLLLGGTG